MIRLPDSLARSRPRLLAVLITLLIPAALPADTVVFRNECRSPVLVEARWVERGVLKREQQLLRYMESTPKINMPCDKVISVLDAKNGRVLFRGALKTNPTPRAFGIVFDPRRPNTVQLQPRRLATNPLDR